MKKIVSLLLAVAMVCTVGVNTFAASDISGHWASGALAKAETEGWLDVKEDNSFYPNANATRQEVVYMVYSSQLNRTTSLDLTAKKNLDSFNDKSKMNSKYITALETLYGNGLIKGYEDGSFKPEGDITRAEAATIISNLLAQKQFTTNFYGFNDYIPDWAKINIERCARAGVISGYKDNTFAPSNNVTRAEIVMMLSKLNEFNAEVPEPTEQTTKKVTTTEATTETTTEATTEATSEETTEETTIPVNEEKAKELLESINNERTENNINILELDDRLCEIAMLRAVEMYEKNAEDEVSPTYGNIDKQITDNGIKYIECSQFKVKGVSRGVDVIAQVEMMGYDYEKLMAPNFNKVGIGYYNDRWCVVYIKE